MSYEPTETSDATTYPQQSRRSIQWTAMELGLPHLVSMGNDHASARPDDAIDGGSPFDIADPRFDSGRRWRREGLEGIIKLARVAP